MRSQDEHAGNWNSNILRELDCLLLTTSHPMGVLRDAWSQLVSVPAIAQANPDRKRWRLVLGHLSVARSGKFISSGDAASRGLFRSAVLAANRGSWGYVSGRTVFCHVG